MSKLISDLANQSIAIKIGDEWVKLNVLSTADNAKFNKLYTHVHQLYHASDLARVLSYLAKIKCIDYKVTLNGVEYDIRDNLNEDDNTLPNLNEVLDYYGVNNIGARVTALEEGGIGQAELALKADKTDLEALEKNIYVAVRLKEPTIGDAGTQGFGVSYADATDDELKRTGMTPLSGTFDKTSDNYGNYKHTRGGTFVWLPICYLRIAGEDAPQYSVYGVNSIEVVPYNRYANEAAALADGFVLPRCFIDGGKVVPGIFVQKYEPSAVNIAGTTYYAGVPGVKGVVSITAPTMIAYAKALGDGVNVEPIFSKTLEDFIALAHAQQSDTTAFNAWYQGANSAANRPVQNNPNYAAAASHNGQLNGIMQFSQCWWEFKLGITTAGSNGTQGQTGVTENALYLMKKSVKLSDFTGEFGGATDAWGTADSLQSGMYDRYELTNFNLRTSRDPLYWGNGSNRIFNDPSVSDAENAICGVIPYNDASLSSAGVNMMGGATCAYYTSSTGGTTQNLALYTSGEHYNNHTVQSNFSRNFNVWRPESYVGLSFRAAVYLQ